MLSVCYYEYILKQRAEQGNIMNTVTITKTSKVEKGVYRVEGTSVTVEKDLDGRAWIFKVSGKLMPFSYKTLAMAADEGRKTYNRMLASGMI